MIRAWLASALYILAFPVAMVNKLFTDPMALKKSHRGWKKWPKERPGIDGARRPYL